MSASTDLSDTPLAEPEDWGPQDVGSWLEQDPLEHVPGAEAHPQREVRGRLEFEGWLRLPPLLRRLSWREREIAAALAPYGIALHDPTVAATGIAGTAYGTGVTVQPTAYGPRLCGVILVDAPRVADLPPWIFGLETSLSIPTRIQGIHPLPEERVPLLIESHPRPAPLLGPEDILLQNGAIAGSTPVISSGQPVAGITPVGMMRPGTLTAVATDIASEQPVILGARHVFGGVGNGVVMDDPQKYWLGTVTRDNEALDAATATLETPICLDLALKDPTLRPRDYVIATNAMAVQTYGAETGHHTGYVTMTYQSPFGGHAYGQRGWTSVRDFGTAPGDSGALLVSGHGSVSAIPPPWEVYDPAYVASHVCAAIGMLSLGPKGSAASTNPPDSVFVSLADIQSALNVRINTQR